MEITRTQLLPGVWLSCLETDKFKSDCISISLLTELDRETISKNALLPRVLARGTVSYPAMDALAAACDELYGARVLPIVRKKGEMLCMGFYAGFIADRFTPDGERLLEPVCQLLGELLLHPATRGGLLRRDYVESEKQKLIEDIRARVNDKRDYALFRACEEMCAYEAYACDDMGSESGAEDVGYVELTRHYHDLLQSCPIEIFYCGSASPARVSAALNEALSTLPRGELDCELGTDIRLNSVEAEPRFFTEELDVTQGKLVLGFRMGECMDEPNFAALRVFNALYGGCVTSKLFMNVREKLSLCYYASSFVDRLKGVMFVSSGIEFGNFDSAKLEILAQLDAVRTGDFTDEELNSARRAMASDLRSMTDSPGALEDFYLTQALLGLDYGPADMALLCGEVTREDILSVAAGTELDTVYFLRAPKCDEEAETEDDD